MSTTKNPKVNIKKDILELYDNVSRGFWDCSEYLDVIKTQIEECKSLSKQSKTALLNHYQTLVDEMNAIVNKIAQLGKVK